MVERVAKAVRGVGLSARTRVSPAFWFADRAGGYRLTLLVLFGAVGLVWTVPHIRAPLADMPTDPVEGIVLGLNVVLACLIYGGAWLCALPIGEVTAASPVIAAGTNGFFARGHRWAQPGGVAIDRVAAYCGNDSWVASGLLVAAIAPTLLWPETPILSHLSFLLSWIVIWGLGSRLLRKRWSERLGEDAGSAAIEAGIKLIGRTFTLILVTHALVEIVWGIHADLITVFGIYSRWAFAQALFASVMLVRAVDVLALLGLLGRGSLRFVFFLACSCVYISWGESGIPIGSRATDASAAGSAGIGVRLGLTGHAFARPEEPRSSWLADFVARLDEIPRDQPAVLVAASGGGSRAAITAGLVFEKLARTSAVQPGEQRRTLAQNVVLVSSVSGGSLATAYFVTHGASGSLAKGAAEEYETSFIKKMSIDFMAPLLRGVLTMRLERGEAVAHFWRDKFAWQNEFDTTERKAKRPLVVLNATDVQSGERVGIGFPALPAGLLTPARVTADLSPGLRINLADGVRTSANFPYGFEYVKLGDRPYELIDGGVVDNTGLDTLTLVLEGLGRTATDPKMSKEDRALAERARDGLRDRGLLVVEIDAGARPEKPKGLAAHVPSLSKPLEALGRAGHRNSAALRARWLERLKTAIDPPFVGLVRAGADCTPEGDVITAWALDRRERRKIFDTFHVTEKRLTKALELQQRSIRRMHALRRAMLAGDPTAKELATTLSGAHQDYQERVSQHATDQYLCAPAEDTQHKDPTPDEKTPDPAAELKGVEDALKLALRGSLDGTAPSPLPGVPAAAPATAPPAAAPPAPVEVVAAPAIEDREALGWVYLGTRVGQKWQTRYATWQGPPQAGVRVRLIGRSNLRASMPDENGASGKIRMALPSNAELDILEVRSWGDIFVWARVAAPK